jgi:hypothetical protein
MPSQDFSKPVSFERVVTTTFTSQPTAVPGLVYARIDGPNHDQEGFFDVADLEGAHDFASATEAFASKAWHTLTEEGERKIHLGMGAKGDLASEDFADDPEAIDPERLYRDARWQTGWAWQRGREIPLNGTLYQSFASEFTDLSKEFIELLENHPWIELEGPRYVPGNGQTYNLRINLPEDAFARLYGYLSERKRERPVSPNDLSTYLFRGSVYHDDEPAERDLLGVWPIMVRGAEHQERRRQNAVYDYD